MHDEGPLPVASHVRVMDGMRGLAILLVLMYHYWQLSFWSLSLSVPGDSYSLEYIQISGALGVELFFFISAFCLCYPHAKAMFGQGPVPTLRHFYYRRFIKIVPSYLLALVVFGVGFASLYVSNYKHGVLADIGMHLIFVHNFTAETRSSFDSVMWSLAVEVQFYYLFPLLAWCFRRVPKLTVTGMVAVAILWRVYSRTMGVSSYEQWDNQLPGFLDFFAFGMLAAYVIVWLRQRPNAMRRLRFALTFMAIVAFVLLLAMFRWQADLRWQQDAAGVWRSQNRQWLAVIFLFIAVCSAYSIGLWRRILANPVLTFLSTISYNLYLWHQSVGLLIRDRHWWPSTTDPPMSDPHWRWTYLIVAVGSSILIATVITYAFERPLLKHGVFGALAKLTRGRIDLASPTLALPAADQKMPDASSVATWARHYLADVRRQPALVAIGAFVVTVFLSAWRSGKDSTYPHLAASFNQGHLGILGMDVTNAVDALPLVGHHAVNGPIPAVLSMPFVGLFGASFNQVSIAAALVGVAAAATWVLCSRAGLNVIRTGAVTFVTVGVELMFWVARGDFTALAQLGAFAFIMLALAEWAGECRPWLVVFWVVCAGESRLILIIFVPVLLLSFAVRFSKAKPPSRFLRRGTAQFQATVGMAVCASIVLRIWCGHGSPSWSDWATLIDCVPFLPVLVVRGLHDRPATIANELPASARPKVLSAGGGP